MPSRRPSGMYRKLRQTVGSLLQRHPQSAADEEAVDEDDLALIEQTAESISNQRSYYDPIGPAPSDATSPLTHEEITDEWIPSPPPVPPPVTAPPTAMGAKTPTDPPAIASADDEPDLPATLESLDEADVVEVALIEELNLPTVTAPAPVDGVMPWSGEDDNPADFMEQIELFSTEELAEIEGLEVLDQDDPTALLDLLDDVPDIGEVDSADDGEFDWEAVVLEDSELDTPPSRQEFEEVMVRGSLSRRDRARQIAIEVGGAHGWDTAGIALLTEVFYQHWWSMARRSMERELEAGMSPEELELAMEIRAFWRDRPEFSIDFHGFRSEQSSPRYSNISWPLALALARAWPGYPDPEEIGLFLDEQYDRWYCSRPLRRKFTSFLHYLYVLVEPQADHPRCWLNWDFVGEECPADWRLPQRQMGPAVEEQRALRGLGLIASTKRDRFHHLDIDPTLKRLENSLGCPPPQRVNEPIPA